VRREDVFASVGVLAARPLIRFPSHTVFQQALPACGRLIMRTVVVCLVAATALNTVALSQIACSRDNEAVQAADTSIGIETSQMFVTIENRAGAPLLDLTVAIQTPGAAFTHLIARLEAGQKQEVPLNSFSSRDGTSFNLRLSKPRAVRVNATDLTSKKHEAQVSWK
jgi:hypothetical protein